MKICSMCKKDQDDDQFISEKYGRATKVCQRCRDRVVMYSKNNRCQHGRAKHKCRECTLDPKVPLAQQMWYSSKQADKKRGRYDPENHITTEEILDLLEEYPCCVWDDCGCDLQYIHYQNNLATIERLCNDIGHLSGNCVIACYYCNIGKKSNGYGGSHVCVKCATGESVDWYKIDGEWHCRRCWEKIPVICEICDKKITKSNISRHMKRKH